MPKKKTTTKKMTPTKEICALKAVVLFMLSAMEHSALLDKAQIQVQLDKLSEVGQFKYSEADYYENMGKEQPTPKPF